MIQENKEKKTNDFVCSLAACLMGSQDCLLVIIKKQKLKCGRKISNTDVSSSLLHSIRCPLQLVMAHQFVLK